MPTIYDYAAYLRQALEPKYGKLGKVQLQKLLYAINRVFIALGYGPAFKATCYAWPLGPVFIEIHRPQGNTTGSASVLTAQQRATVDIVLLRLGGMSGAGLAIRSHKLYCEWKNARKGLRPTECGQAEITTPAIRVAVSPVANRVRDTWRRHEAMLKVSRPEL